MKKLDMLEVIFLNASRVLLTVSRLLSTTRGAFLVIVSIVLVPKSDTFSTFFIVFVKILPPKFVMGLVRVEVGLRSPYIPVNIALGAPNNKLAGLSFIFCMNSSKNAIVYIIGEIIKISI